METRSIKSLSLLRLQGNQHGNRNKTLSFLGSENRETMRITSIEKILDSILKESMDKIIETHEGRQYHATDEIRASEDDIDRLYRAVLSGQGSLSDFQSTCQKWLLICNESLTNNKQTKLI
jgi:hypothetical protein